MTQSRLSLARKAIRPALKGRLMMAGPSGAGKTRCLLIAGTVLAEDGPVLVIDTEKESALTYADDFDFAHLPWHPPFNPAELVDVLHDAGDQYAVIVVDSITHFWRGEGGVLDTAAGKWTGWKEARPLQEALVDAILMSPAHVLLGARSKVEHTQETENGRQVVKKLGMAVQQDDNLEFELNVAIDLSMEHTATITKSRTTALPVGRAFRGHQIGDMAGIYRDWLKGGEPPADRVDVEDLASKMDALPEGIRKECKKAFFAAFGRPEQLGASSVAAARQLVAGFDGSAVAVAGTGADGADGAPFEEPDPPAVSDTSTASLIDARQAQQLHRDLGRAADKKDGYGITAKADQEALIYVCSKGRTVHASELTRGEWAMVYQFAQNVKDNKVTLDDVRATADGHRRANEAAADFDRQIGAA